MSTDRDDELMIVGMQDSSSLDSIMRCVIVAVDQGKSFNGSLKGIEDKHIPFA